MCYEIRNNFNQENVYFDDFLTLSKIRKQQQLLVIAFRGTFSCYWMKISRKAPKFFCFSVKYVVPFCFKYHITKFQSFHLKTLIGDLNFIFNNLNEVLHTIIWKNEGWLPPPPPVCWEHVCFWCCFWSDSVSSLYEKVLISNISYEDFLVHKHDTKNTL